MNNSKKIKMLSESLEVLEEFNSIKDAVKKYFKGNKSKANSIQKICSGNKKDFLIVNNKNVTFRYF